MATILSREETLETVGRIIAPFLGGTMARAAVEMHRQKLGIDGRQMTPEQLEELLGRIGTGLIIFVGREKSEQIVREALAAVLDKENGQ